MLFLPVTQGCQFKCSVLLWLRPQICSSGHGCHVDSEIGYKNECKVTKTNAAFAVSSLLLSWDARLKN